MCLESKQIPICPNLVQINTDPHMEAGFSEFARS